MSHLAAYRFEVSFPGNLTGAFIIGSSLIGGSDLIGIGYEDVSAATEWCRIRRGMTGDMGAMAAGTASFGVLDVDGRFNPQNPTSPLAGLIRPMRPVRIWADYDGFPYRPFTGYATRITHKPGLRGMTIFDCVDMFEWLAHGSPIIASTGPTTVGAAFGLMLDYLGIVGAELRDLDVGSSIPDFEADGEKSFVTIATELLAADHGLVYVSGAGAFTYRSRGSVHRRRPAEFDLTTDIVSHLEPSTDVRHILNRYDVQRTGGVTQTASDAASRLEYGDRKAGKITSDYILDDATALSMANWLVAEKSQPRPPTRGIELIDVAPAQVLAQLGIEIGTVVEVAEPWGGTSTLGAVQTIQHDISREEHKTPLTIVDEGSSRMFTIGPPGVGSLIGGVDLIGF